MRPFVLRAHRWQAPHSSSEVDFTPQHACGFFTTLAKEQSQPNRISRGTCLRIEAHPQPANLVIGEYSRSWCFAEALHHPSCRMCLNQTAIEGDREHSANQRL